MDITIDKNRYLNIKNVQEMTGLSYLTVYRMFTEGKIKGAIQMGNRWMVSLADWNNHIKELKNASKSSASLR